MVVKSTQCDLTSLRMAVKSFSNNLTAMTIFIKSLQCDLTTITKKVKSFENDLTALHYEVK